MKAINELTQLAHTLGEALARNALSVTTAESCTGGLVSKLITDVAGSSGWFGYGFVTYSDEAKMRLLGVSARTLAEEGAVSEATVRAMASGARAASGANIAVAVSGIAGPNGGTTAKPVGTVWFAWVAKDGSLSAEQQRFSGNRAAVREAAAKHALEGLLELAR